MKSARFFLRNLAIPLALIALFYIPSVTVGQTLANPDSALLAILDEIEGTPLPLQEAVQHALENATSVRRAEAAYLAARGSVRRERGFFDPELFFGLDYLDLEEPTASFFAGAPVLTTQQTLARTGLRMNLPIGTELELAMNTHLPDPGAGSGGLYTPGTIHKGGNASGSGIIEWPEANSSAGRGRSGSGGVKGIFSESLRNKMAWPRRLITCWAARDVNNNQSP